MTADERSVLSLAVALVVLVAMSACCLARQFGSTNRYAACAEACGPGRLARVDYSSCVCTEAP